MNNELKKAYDRLLDLQTILIYLLKQSTMIEEEVSALKLKIETLKKT